MTAEPIYIDDTGMAHAEEKITRLLGSAVADGLGRDHPRSAVEMLAAEKARSTTGGRVADLLTARDIIRAHRDPDFVRETKKTGRERLRRQAPGARRVKCVGRRMVAVRLSNGLVLNLPTPYVRPSRKGQRGRPRGTGKRREAGAGAYPVLDALGVTDHVTPLTRSDIARQTVVSSSYAEARDQLARGGLEVNDKTLIDISVRTGQEAIDRRDEALARACREPLPGGSPLAGKRIRVSVDGGRARTRQTHADSPKGKNGRRPFDLAWREPRIITLDVFDDDGVIDHGWRPIYETTLGAADAVFALLCGLLRILGAHLAREIVFVADGATWIWERVDQLIRDAELPVDRVHKVLDYYHATEHIADALRACKSLDNTHREALHDELKGLLLKPGGAAAVLERLRPMARGRRGRRVNKELRYLEGHLEHMNYAALRDRKLPIGSGIVESAVRRVLNLRFKSASTCWRTDHLEPLLYLRAIAKSGRWDDFMRAWLDHAHWLQPKDPVVLPPSRMAA